MKKMLTMLLVMVVGASIGSAQTAMFSEDFEADFLNSDWNSFYAESASITAAPMASAPATLAGGGSFVGLVHDTTANAAYTGAAELIGSINSANYTIETDVYIYSYHDSGSAYTGLVVYADTASGIYIKLAADFDANRRFRLYNNNFSMSTYTYTFYQEYDASALDTTEGWHNLKVEVETLDDSTTAYTCYYDGTMLGTGAAIDTSTDRLTSGQYGLFSFGGGAAGLPGYFDNVVVTPTVINSEDFEAGSVSGDWGSFYAASASITTVAMASAPATLAGGGDFVGLVHDTTANAAYTGAAELLGSVYAANYTIETDVYIYSYHDSGSAYTGLVVSADTARGLYVKLAADFDANRRFRLYNNNFSMATYAYTFYQEYDASALDTTEGWHNLKVEVEVLEDGYTAYTCYYDGTMLGDGAAIDSSSDRLYHGQYGVFAFGGGSAGLPGYFDNLKVYGGTIIYDDPVVIEAIEPKSRVTSILPLGFALAQNYPNPFNPNTNIPIVIEVGGKYTLEVFNLNGQLVRTLLNETMAPGSYSILWNGLNQASRQVTSGVYFYRLANGPQRVTKRMVFLK